MKRRLLAAVLAAGALGAAGCSSDAPSPALSDGAARQLQADVLAVTQSAAVHNWTAARTELGKLNTDLAAARSAGTVSAARVSAIEAAVAAVSSDLAAAATTTSAPPKTTPAKTTPARTTAPPKPNPRPTKRKHGGGGG